MANKSANSTIKFSQEAVQALGDYARNAGMRMEELNQIVIQKNKELQDSTDLEGAQAEQVKGAIDAIARTLNTASKKFQMTASAATKVSNFVGEMEAVSKRTLEESKTNLASTLEKAKQIGAK